MKTLLLYLVQVIAASGILYGYYHLALRNKKFHKYNRYYLMAAILVSLLVPFLNIPVYFTAEETASSSVLRTLTGISTGTDDQFSVIATTRGEVLSTSWFTWEHIALLFYSIVGILALLRIILSLKRIRTIAKNNPVEHLDNIHFVYTSEPGTPFSFFRWLFWNRKIELKSPEGGQIFRHEYFHIREKHSLDIIALEFLTVLFWINPFFHLVKKEIKTIHEFLADQFALNEQKHPTEQKAKWDYAELLLMQVLNTQQHLVNPFFHNQIKRRVAMITSSKKPGYQYLRKLMVFPVAVIVLALFAFNYKEKNKSNDELALSVSNHIGITDTTKIRVPGKIVWIEEFIPEKKTPNAAQLKLWTDPKIYGVWLNDKRVDNAQLTKYQASDFAYYFESKLEKNATNYGKHFYQVGLLTNQYYTKVYLNPEKIQKFMMLRDPTKPLFKNISNQKILIVIDGIIKDKLTINKIDENININSIASVTILKGLSAHSKYGDKGNNGVIEIETISKQPVTAIEFGGPDKSYKGDIVFKEVTGGKVYLSNVTILGKVEAKDTTQPLDGMLIFINGKERPDLKTISDIDGKLDPAGIIHVNILKEPHSSQKYGDKGKKGVIEIFTKQYDKKNELGIPRADTIRPEIIDVKVFSRVEIEASFPGGYEAWRKYLERSLDASIPAKKKAPDGAYTVIVQFIVDKNGVISEIKALTKHGYGMEEEAMRVIRVGPNWIPAIQNGHQVKAYRKQPITFIVGKGEKNFRPTTKNDKDALNEVTVVDLANSKKEPADDNIIFEKVEIAPSFPGGDAKWKEYLTKNIHGMIPVDSGAPAGKYTIIVQFIVRKDGFISDLKTLTKHGFGMEEEALRVIKNGPRWVPAIQNGRQVTAYKQQPITFLISEEDPDPVITKNKENGEPKIPEISLAQLRKADVYKLLHVDEGTEIISFRFTTDLENGDIKETYNSGAGFSESTKKLIADIKSGAVITIEEIRVKKDGIERKIPAQVYRIVS